MNIIYNQKQLFLDPIENFQDWKDKNPNWESEYNVVPESGGHADYRRIVVKWKDNVKDQKTGSKKKIEHIYTPAINIKTGDVYLDCRKRKIFAKFSTFIFIRPLHTIGLTLYHGLGIGVANQIFKTMKGKQTYKEGLINSGRSIVDIARTPIYGLALSVIDVYAVIFAAIKPNSLYKFREISGKIEMALHRTVDGTADTPLFAACFMPVGNFRTMEQCCFEDEEDKTIKNGLETYAWKQVHFRQNHRAIFNDCCMLYPKNKGYVSASYNSASQ